MSSSSYNNIGGMAGPVVVQGTPMTNYENKYDSNSYQQQPQSTQKARQGGCRDVFWAILFYAHLGLIGYLTAIYGPQAASTAYEQYGGDGGERALEEQQAGDDDGGFTTQDIDIDPKAIVVLTGISGILGCIVSSLAMGFMVRFAETLIKTALIFNVVIFGVMAIGSLVTGMLPGALMGLLMCGFSAYYTCRVWSRVPFAAANLITAVTAVKANMGLVFYAYVSLLLVFGWTIWWSAASVSTMLVVHECDEEGNCGKEIQGLYVFLFFVSYFWTCQVITNVVHVTVAGTVGSWWWVPHEAKGCCSKAVRESYVRSLTTSFGSICFGSLIVAIIQAVKEMVRAMREQDDGMLLCIAECLIGCLESIVEYFNKWAFVYVGLYGFSFMESGSSVMTLFKNRGWTSIITDLMVDTVLNLVGAGVGAITALVAVVIGAALGLGSTATLITAGAIGFALGYGMASVLFSVVSSAVNTVVVCYAEAPNEFHTNHPQLASNMRDAWREAFPNDFNY